MGLTASQRRALEIVRDHGPIKPREFSEKMWPESPGHQRYSKCGPSGVTRGGGMNLAAGGYLGRLRKRGWVKSEYAFWVHSYYRDLGYVLTDEGREALE